MESTFSANSYYLLGLSTSADQGEIKKQARLIIARLGIDEGDLDSDLPHLEVNRTENVINQAVQRLSNPLKKVKEVYFWFSDDNDPQLTSKINSLTLDQVYDYLRERSDKEGKWNDKRNLAIFLIQLLQYKKIYKKYLEESLDLWKSLIDSESSWKYFELYYKNIDDLATDASIFSGLRSYVNKEIPDIYTELSQKWDDKEYAQLCSKLFNTISSTTEKKVFEPCVNKINEACKKLNSIKWEKDEPSKENFQDVKDAIDNIQKQLNLLIENGIFEITQSVVLRDKAAESIRSVGIKIYNDYLDYEKADKIIKIADEIAGTTALKNQIGEDKTTAKKAIETEAIVLPILELAKDKQWSEALELIDRLLQKHSNNNETTNILKLHEREVVMMYALEQHGVAMDELKNGRPMGCKEKLDEVQKFLLKRIDIFNISKAWIDSIDDTIRESTGRINTAQVTILDNYRAKKVEDLQKEFGELPEATVSIILFNTYFYIPLCEYYQKVRNRSQTASSLITLGFWTILFYGLGLIPLIIGYYLKNNEVVYVR